MPKVPKLPKLPKLPKIKVFHLVMQKQYSICFRQQIVNMKLLSAEC
jgi:hypothetical protein